MKSLKFILLVSLLVSFSPSSWSEAPHFSRALWDQCVLGNFSDYRCINGFPLDCHAKQGETLFASGEPGRYGEVYIPVADDKSIIIGLNGASFRTLHLTRPTTEVERQNRLNAGYRPNFYTTQIENWGVTIKDLLLGISIDSYLVQCEFQIEIDSSLLKRITKTLSN